jgi:hypothetical protein
MNEYNLTTTHVSVIRDALETQIEDLKNRIKNDKLSGKVDGHYNLFKSLTHRMQVFDVMNEILTMNSDDVDIHIKR